MYNFGTLILEILGGPKAVGLKHCILENKDEIREGKVDFFEFNAKGKERKQAFKVLEIGLSCSNCSPEGIPSIDQILYNILEVL